MCVLSKADQQAVGRPAGSRHPNGQDLPPAHSERLTARKAMIGRLMAQPLTATLIVAALLSPVDVAGDSVMSVYIRHIGFSPCSVELSENSMRDIAENAEAMRTRTLWSLEVFGVASAGEACGGPTDLAYSPWKNSDFVGMRYPAVWF